MEPQEHQAYVAFMLEWDSPADISLGYREAFADSERRIVDAAVAFAKASAPPAVREALITWLRPKMDGQSSWNPAAGALRIICDTKSCPEVVELRKLLDTVPTTDGAVTAFLNAHIDAVIEVRGALVRALWERPEHLVSSADDLRAYIDGTLLP